MLRNNRFLLSSIAVSVSFGISLLTTRDFGKAFLTGLTTLPATVIAATVVERRSLRQAGNRLVSLKRQIRNLQRQRAEAYQALLELQHTAAPQPPTPNPFQPDVRLLQLPATQRPRTRQVVSWDLSAPLADTATIEIKPHELPTQLQPIPASDSQTRQMQQADTELSHVVAAANATKKQITANLDALQTELGQMRQQVVEQTHRRDHLTKEISDLQQQKQHLATEITELERCRSELEQFLTYAEGKKQELETGTHPLQISLKQLQAQSSVLQEELHLLESQVSDRQNEKESLDQQLSTHPLHNTLKQLQSKISQLQEEMYLLESQISDRRQQKDHLEQQLATLQPQPVPTHPLTPIEPVPPPSAAISEQNGAKNGKKNGGKPNHNGHARPLAKPVLEKNAVSPEPDSPANSPVKTLKAAPVRPPSVERSETPGAELADEWAEFMVQLPEYEFLVLRAIAEQTNPTAILKKVAEDNLTMPELLIDSINERALDIVGDMVIDPGTSTGNAAISRDHIKTIKKLIKTYQFLTE